MLLFILFDLNLKERIVKYIWNTTILKNKKIAIYTTKIFKVVSN